MLNKVIWWRNKFTITNWMVGLERGIVKSEKYVPHTYDDCEFSFCIIVYKYLHSLLSNSDISWSRKFSRWRNSNIQPQVKEMEKFVNYFVFIEYFCEIHNFFFTPKSLRRTFWTNQTRICSKYSLRILIMNNEISCGGDWYNDTLYTLHTININ